MLLSVLAEKIQAKQLGDDVSFSNVSTDTRSIKSGDLFVALKGDRFDAHEFVGKAFESGAVAALVQSELKDDKPHLVVSDTRLGLGQVGKAWLQQFDVKKIALTGSSGKTTVKEMIAAILSQQASTLATQGNLNNDIGVPLTLCRLRPEHQYAVIEMGANHMGEIDYVSALVEPDVALVNNVGPAHLEGFGSIENVSKAKGEIYSNLASGGIAVINLDDQYGATYLQQTKNHPQITFSMSCRDADVVLESLEQKASGQYHFKAQVKGELIEVNLPLLGMHNVNNALAAVSICSAVGVSLDAMVAGLQSLAPVNGRLCPVTDISSCHVIDDSYNANPASIKSAIDILSNLKFGTVLVLGDMAELGENSEAEHELIGRYANEKGIGCLYAVGKYSQAYGRGFGAGFVAAECYEEVAQSLLNSHQGKTVLIKGSRSAAMENVIHCLKNLEKNKEGSH